MKHRNTFGFIGNLIWPQLNNTNIGKLITTCATAKTRTNNDESRYYAHLLQDSIARKSISEAKRIHTHMIENIFRVGTFLENRLIDLHLKYGSVEDARQVFDKMAERDISSWNTLIGGYTKIGVVDFARELFERMPERDEVSWNTIIGCYARHGYGKEALKLFSQMKLADMKVNHITFGSVLSACACMEALDDGVQVHLHAIKTGFDLDVVVGSTLIDMYAKCEKIEDARKVFDKMHDRNIYLWNAILRGYARKGFSGETLGLYNQMQEEGVQPDNFTFPSVLKACRSLSAGKEIHHHIAKAGYELDIFVGTGLVDMYAKCGSIEDARQIFDKMPERDAVMYTAMIAAYAQNGDSRQALALFNQMQAEGLAPDLFTVVSVLQACADLGAIEQGKWVHDYIIRKGYELDIFVVTALVDMYAKCRRLDIARHLFDNIRRPNGVLWTAIISAHAQNGDADEALGLFQRMQFAGWKPDSVTVMSLLQACARAGDLMQGKELHCSIIKSGFESDVCVNCSLIDMYAKCRGIEISCQLFERLPERNVVLWNAMISGYAQNGHAHEALTLHHRMQSEELTPDSVTMLSILTACALLGALHEGKVIHGYIIKRRFELDIFLKTALIDMYAKCGSIDIARQLFDSMSDRNVVSWSAIISGYGMHGYGKAALDLFHQMQHSGIKPDDITFISVLSVCSHAGLVDEGRAYFDCMIRDYNISPRGKHYACMVDLLGRAGHLQEARDFIKGLPVVPDASVWGALLSACRIHCNVEVGEWVAENLFELYPENPAYYILLSNTYAGVGRWDDAAKVRKMMKDRCFRKTPGRSLIEVNNATHKFHVGYGSHV